MQCMQVMQRFVCGEPSPQPTNDDDVVNDASETDVDSVEAVGFSPRSRHTVHASNYTC